MRAGCRGAAFVITGLARRWDVVKACNAGVVCPPELMRAVRDSVRTVGENETMKRFSLTRTTIARVLGGLPVRRGTIALIREVVNAHP